MTLPPSVDRLIFELVARPRPIAAPPAPLVACPWCPGFDPADPRHAGASHGICAACAAALEAAAAARRAAAGCLEHGLPVVAECDGQALCAACVEVLRDGDPDLPILPIGGSRRA